MSKLGIQEPEWDQRPGQQAKEVLEGGSAEGLGHWAADLYSRQETLGLGFALRPIFMSVFLLWGAPRPFPLQTCLALPPVHGCTHTWSGRSLGQAGASEQATVSFIK